MNKPKGWASIAIRDINNDQRMSILHLQDELISPHEPHYISGFKQVYINGEKNPATKVLTKGNNNPPVFWYHSKGNNEYGEYAIDYKVDSLKLRGRTSELERLLFWANSNNDDYSIFSIIGKPGSGKSRLALQLCYELHDKDWTIIWLQRNISKSSILEKLKAQLKNEKKVLIVIDDITFCEEFFYTIDRYLTNRYFQKMPFIIRILLTAYIPANKQNNLENDVDILAKIKSTHIYKSMELPSLSEDNIKEIIDDYYRAETSHTISYEKKKSIIDKIVEIKMLEAAPLYARFLVKAICADISIDNWDVNTVLEYIIQNENQKLQDSLDRLESYKKTSLLNAISIIKMIGAITVSHVKYEQIKELSGIEALYLLNDVGLYTELKELLVNLGICDSRSRFINGIQPDTLSFYYCKKVLLDRNMLTDNEFNQVLKFVLKEGKGYSVDFLSLLSRDLFSFDKSKTENNLVEMDLRLEAIRMLYYEGLGILSLTSIPDRSFNARIEMRDSINEIQNSTPSSISDKIASVFANEEAIHKHVNDNDFALLFTLFECPPINIVSYTGYSIYGRACGRGSVLWNDVTFYTGTFHCGHAEGLGKFKHLDGRCYECDMHNGFREGFGTYIWQDFTQYTGQWLAGLRHGEGEMIYPDGRHLKGIWILDHYINNLDDLSFIQKNNLEYLYEWSPDYGHCIKAVPLSKLNAEKEETNSLKWGKCNRPFPIEYIKEKGFKWEKKKYIDDKGEIYETEKGFIVCYGEYEESINSLDILNIPEIIIEDNKYCVPPNRGIHAHGLEIGSIIDNYQT